MTAQQVAVWGLVFGVGLGALWLFIRAVQWIGRWPAPLRPQSTQRSTPAAPQHHQTSIQLGPPRRVELTMLVLPGGNRVRRGPPLIVPIHHDPLWMEKGWQRNGNGYTGYYRAGRRQWRGLIRIPYRGAFEAYIWGPPLAELAARTHYRPCFQSSGGGGRYRIHFHSTPTSLDHAITTVEGVLAEANGVRTDGNRITARAVWR